MNEDLPPDAPAEPPAATPAPATPVAPAAAARAPEAPGWERATMERLLFATLEEQKTARRWRAFVRLAWLAFFIFLIWTLSPRGPAGADKLQPHTAVIEIQGEIDSGAEASAEFVIAAAKAAFEDQGAQAVVLLINSPGGSPVQAGIINDEIRRLKGKHRKKVYAVVEDICASGAYYIAVAADEIYTDKASIIGSIGVLMDGFGFVDAMRKLGVERRLYTAGENKGMNDPFSPESDKQKAYTGAMLEQIHKQFIRVVKEGRGKRLKETPETFTGLYWNGEEAVKQGLADRLGNLDYVAREVVKAEEIVDYTPKENIAEKLAKRIGSSIGAGIVRTLQGGTGLR